MKYAKNYPDAEDVLQDSFVTIFEKIHQYKYQGSFEGWAKRIAINTALKRYRSQSKLQIVKEIETSEEVTLEVDEVIETDFLLNSIQELPDKYRLVFNLYAMDHFSHKEISEMLNISVGTSKSNLSRARLILKEKIIAHRKQQEKA